MKKFALTAVALAMFSGAATAANVFELPEGYKAIASAIDGKVIVYHPNGTQSQHAVLEDTIIKGSNGAPDEMVKGAGENFEKVNKEAQDYNAAFNKPVYEWTSGAAEGGELPEIGHTPMPDYGNGGEAADPEIDPEFGVGAVPRPQPGTGAETPTLPEFDEDDAPVDRPHPGGNDDGFTHPGDVDNNLGGPERPYPGQGEAPERPRPGNGEGSVERPQPPAFIGQINQNKDNIAAMGDAFEQRVDKVNGWLNQAGEAIKNNSAAIQNNSDRITNLESAFEQQAAHTNREIARLDDRIDGIGAMSQAVTAARPQLFGNQTSAIGMGIGHMGDATALAAGYVHRINENWSANANISTTFGTDDRDTSVGAGVAYAW